MSLSMNDSNHFLCVTCRYLVMQLTFSGTLTSFIFHESATPKLAASPFSNRSEQVNVLPFGRFSLTVVDSSVCVYKTLSAAKPCFLIIAPSPSPLNDLHTAPTLGQGSHGSCLIYQFCSRAWCRLQPKLFLL